MKRKEWTWKDKPFAKITASFISGLLLASNTLASKQFWSLAFVVTLAFSLIYENLPAHLKWYFKKTSGILMHLILIAWGGWVYTCFSFTKNKPIIETNSFFIYKIEKTFHSSHPIKRYLIAVFQLDSNRAEFKGKGILALYENNQKVFDRNAVILSRLAPQQLKSKLNPGETDFKKIQNRNGVFWRTAWNKDKMMLLRNGEADWISYLDLATQYIVTRIKKYIITADHANLASALLIGYKDDLNSELIEAYVNTGVIHVIAISGMHLGLFFSIFSGISNKLMNKARAKQFGVGILLPLIWGFSAMTGSSPSIVRSAWMLTGVLISQVIYRKNSNINGMALAAFLMVSIHPDSFYSLGFQLSFTAVGSLLFYESFFSNILHIENKVIRSIWGIIATTLAAQVLTLPLVIYHFKELPMFFVISNLIVVPLSSLILILLFVLISLSPFPFLAGYLGKGIDWLIYGMNTYVMALDQVPFAQIKLYNWGLISCILLSILLISLFQNNFKWKTYKCRLLFLCTLLIVSIYVEYMKLLQSNKIFIFQKTNSTILVHQHGTQAKLVASTSSNHQPDWLEQFLENTGKELGITQWQIQFIPSTSQILHIESNQEGCKIRQSLDLIHNGSDFRLAEIQGPLPKRLLIADGSNKVWKIREWQSHAQKLNLPLHSTPEKGFISIDCHPFPRR